MSTVTMQELELETAELLPARETLNNCGGGSARPGSGVNQHSRATTATATATCTSPGGGFLGNTAWAAATSTAT